MLKRRIKVSEDCFSINNASHKFSKATLNLIDKAIGSYRKYPKVYKYFVYYIALCMAPAMGKLSVMFISEFLLAIATNSFSDVISQLGLILIQVSKQLVIVFTMYEILKTIIVDTYHDYKNKLN